MKFVQIFGILTQHHGKQKNTYPLQYLPPCSGCKSYSCFKAGAAASKPVYAFGELVLGNPFSFMVLIHYSITIDWECTTLSSNLINPFRFCSSSSQVSMHCCNILNSATLLPLPGKGSLMGSYLRQVTFYAFLRYMNTFENCDLLLFLDASHTKVETGGCRATCLSLN